MAAVAVLYLPRLHRVQAAEPFTSLCLPASQARHGPPSGPVNPRLQVQFDLTLPSNVVPSALQFAMERSGEASRGMDRSIQIISASPVVLERKTARPCPGLARGFAAPALRRAVSHAHPRDFPSRSLPCCIPLPRPRPATGALRTSAPVICISSWRRPGASGYGAGHGDTHTTFSTTGRACCVEADEVVVRHALYPVQSVSHHNKKR